MALERCRVVLIEPHYPGNVGAAARVMANFGLRDLVLVNPVADPRDERARQMATHGEPILDAARRVASFDDAVADCALVIGTSARIGGLFRRQTVSTPEEILPAVADGLASGQAAALVFGSEPHGLSNEIVTRCHHLICIPTNEDFAALNLAQAVAICLYELRRASQSGKPREAGVVAPFEVHEEMYRHLRTALEAIHFVYGDKADALMHGLRHLLGKARLSEAEVKLLHGLARQILWHVEHHR